ncbi:zinc-finger homeodomain protein 2-like [Tripterygium wilfordii]|uniref:Zinc-finger homeodomain protein 2-like n=1 Tax=Tripterygium wilfordii TaxID=458696 RepID=A0A7J7D0F7_TRIWF|nr:zinc-finger homeodomain protein 2-like [Tripterygium wilfordii]KAF5739768.1 zinc-finger homeodomain protein 2-like [Tripterygium wilfordii]
MDFDEQEEEIGMAEATGYDSLGNSSTRSKSGAVRYRECLKNHAVNIGGQAVDGCREFMAAADEGTLDALKCAACNCHRNFHRKEMEGESSYSHQQQHQLQFRRAPAGYLHSTPAPRPLVLPAASGGGGNSREEDNVSNPSSGGGGGGGSGLKRRFRTKFTEDQKNKMLEIAERLGWRIQKHDDETVEQFCAETGVKRNVLKVWMHNNKHTLGKKP